MNATQLNAFDANDTTLDARKASIFAAIPRDRELAEIERYVRENGVAKCPLGASGLDAEFEAIDHDFERSREVFAAHLAEGARLEYGR
jgi:hypothetical protein